MTYGRAAVASKLHAEPRGRDNEAQLLGSREKPACDLAGQLPTLCRAMDDPGVVIASWVLGQLIVTLGLLGVMAATRAWAIRHSEPSDRPRLNQGDPRDVLRRIGSGSPHRQSTKPSNTAGFRLETSQPWRTSNANPPRSVVFPVPPVVAVPISRPGSDAIGFRVDASWHDALTRTPPLVSLPVVSLAGLPIRRPVREGWLGRRKRVKGAARRRVVRRIVSGECPTCQEKRAQGRNYCLDCGRRLTPFLS